MYGFAYFCVMHRKVRLILAAALFFICGFAYAGPPPQAGGKLVDAVQAYESGFNKKAYSILSQLVKSEPSNDAAWYYLGLCEAAAGNSALAAEHLAAAVSLDPSNYWYKRTLAALYRATGDNAKVVSLLEEILSSHPEKRDVCYELLDLYVKEGKYGPALKMLDDIELQSGPGEQAASVRYDILRRSGKPEEALASLLAFNEQYSSPGVLSAIGDHYLSDGRDSLALSFYDEALSLEGNYIPAILGRSEVFRTTFQNEKYFESIRSFVGNPEIPASFKGTYLSNAMRAFDPSFVRVHMDSLDSIMDEGLRAHPTDSTLLNVSGLYFFSTGRTDEGMERLRKNAGLYPGNPSIRLTRLQGMAVLRQWDSLRAGSEKAMADFKDNAPFVELRNIACYNLKDYDAVIENCRAAVEAKPLKDTASVVSNLSMLGDMLHLKGEDREAFKAYARALRLDPGFAPVLNNYAYYLSLKKKRLSKAYNMSKKTLDLEPDNPTYLDTFGWILHLMGKDKEAKSFFKHAMLYGGKESATILDHYATVLEALGEMELSKMYRNQAKAKEVNEE